MTCKDCIHYDVCKKNWEYHGITLSDDIEAEGCDDFKNKNFIIELPCKIGDTLYQIVRRIDSRNKVGYIRGTVLSWYNLTYVLQNQDKFYLTRAAAEAALERRNNERNIIQR